VSRPPRFGDLVGNDLSPAERERLERVHDMLVAAGPPPELPQELAEAPQPQGRLAELARKRLRTGLLLAATLVIATFAFGYFLGASGKEEGQTTFTPAQQVVLGKAADRFAVVEIGERDANGNWPMVVKVDGLEHLSRGDYYILSMTRDGKPIVQCGTFNVAEDGVTTISFPVAYDPARYDGLLLSRWNSEQREDTPLLRADL
jgi:hypothetical protein